MLYRVVINAHLRTYDRGKSGTVSDSQLFVDPCRVVVRKQYKRSVSYQQKLRLIKNATGWSDRVIAGKLGVARRTVAHWIEGDRKPSRRSYKWKITHLFREVGLMPYTLVKKRVCVGQDDVLYKIYDAIAHTDLLVFPISPNETAIYTEKLVDQKKVDLTRKSSDVYSVNKIPDVVVEKLYLALHRARKTHHRKVHGKKLY